MGVNSRRNEETYQMGRRKVPRRPGTSLPSETRNRRRQGPSRLARPQNVVRVCTLEPNHVLFLVVLVFVLRACGVVVNGVVTAERNCQPSPGHVQFLMLSDAIAFIL